MAGLIRLSLFALPIATQLSAAPVLAAKNLECALSLRDDSLDSAMFAAYRKGADTGLVLLERRGKAIGACRANNKWSDRALQSVARVLLGEAVMAGLRKEMAKQSLPVEQLTKVVTSFADEQSAEKRRQMADGEVARETITALRVRFQKAGVLSEGQFTEENGSLLGEYLLAYSNAVFFRQDFAAQ